MDSSRIRIALILLFCTITFGTFGYHFIEGMPFFDAFYMTIITISTVGFSEIKPLSTLGRIVTILIISTGIMIGAYTIGTLLRMFIEGEFGRIFGRRKLERNISAMQGHFIICGYGRIGSIICKELLEDSIPFVIIEEDPSKNSDLEKEGYLYINMDATSEEALMKAGIMSAKGLVTAVRSDANNVFITLTAKDLRPDIFVLSRASDVKNEAKLIKAGASRVVSPYLLGGRRMAEVLKRPTVVDFIDIAMANRKLGLAMEEAKVGDRSTLVGKNLIDSHLRQNYGVIIVAIKKTSGEMIYNPLPSEKLDAGDVIVVIGKKDALKRMSEIM
ncbi:MAG: potassium channel protein [Desulfobacterales bacterium]|jgi:voltage-gated potassium channel